MEAVREEETYKTYTADSLHFILKQLGVGIKKYSELKNPAPEDDRDPDEIARERAAKMGLRVVEG